MIHDTENRPPPPERLEFTAEEWTEFEAWDRLSDEAFEMILRLEAEEAARGQSPQPPDNDARTY